MARKKQRKAPQDPTKASPFRDVRPSGKPKPSSATSGAHFAALQHAADRACAVAQDFASSSPSATCVDVLVAVSVWRLGARRLVGKIRTDDAAGVTLEEVRAHERSVIEALQEVLRARLLDIKKAGPRSETQETAAARELLAELRLARRSDRPVLRVGTVRVRNTGDKRVWTVVPHSPGLPSIVITRAGFDDRHVGTPVLMLLHANDHVGKVTVLDPDAVRRNAARARPRTAPLPPGRAQFRTGRPPSR